VKIKNLFKILLFPFLLFVLFEIFLHAFKPSVYEYSKTLGWEVKKNYKKKFSFVDYYDQTYDGIYETNEYGARQIGDLRADIKILAIGDSFTMDPHTGNETSWFGVLKDGLEKKYKKSFLVSAIGGGGYGTNQQYLFTKKFLKESKLKPDIVILQFCVNDFMNNSYLWETNTENYNQFLRRPFFYQNNHYFYQESLIGKIFRTEFLSKFKTPNYFFLILSIIKQKYFLNEINKNILDNSINITQYLLIKLKNLFKAKNIYAFNCKDTSSYPEIGWISVLDSSGYKVLKNPSSNLKKLSLNEKIFFRDGGHYNELGNKIIGDAILEEITKYKIFN